MLQNRQKVNLNFLTIFDHFWDFFKRLKRGSLGLKKALNFIGRIFLGKIDFEKSPKFRPKVKGGRG